jgi:hypothetical protein
MRVFDSVSKSSLPCRKDAFRLYDAFEAEIADLLTIDGEVPVPGLISGFEVYPELKPVKLNVSEVRKLLRVAWCNGATDVDDIETVKARVLEARENFNRNVLTVRDQKL